MNEDLQQLLINLKLKILAARCEEMLAAAERDATPVATLLAQLFRAEWQARQQAALAARLKRAQLPETWTLETFPFKIQTGVKERQIRAFAQLEFIPKAENIVFIGETGVGKTGLMSALVLKAVQNGYRALSNEQDGSTMKRRTWRSGGVASSSARSRMRACNCSAATATCSSIRLRACTRIRECSEFTAARLKS